MSEFKIGEKVRVIGNAPDEYEDDENHTYHFLDIGTEGEVVSGPDSDNDYFVRPEDDGSGQYVNAGDLERVVPEFKEGQRVLVAEGAKRHKAGSDRLIDSHAAGQTVAVRHGGLDRDGDVALTLDNGDIGWALPEYLTLVEGEPVEVEKIEQPDQGQPFKIGDRVRIVASPVGEDVPVPQDWIGLEGAVMDIADDGRDFPVMVAMKGHVDSCGFKFSEVEKVEDQDTEEPEFEAGDKVRIKASPEDIRGVRVPEQWVGREGEVLSHNPETGDTRVHHDGIDNIFERGEVEKVEDQDTEEPGLKEGDRVRIVANIAGRGEVGTLTASSSASPFPYRVQGVGHFGFVAVREHEVEKVEVPEGDSDDDDSPVGEVPALDPSNLIAATLDPSNLIAATLDPSKIVSGNTVDVVNHPPHYKFSNGAEVIDITENLTSNGGQAVQYIARSTRLDGNNKGDVLEDLAKARWFIDREIERVENQG